MNQHKNSERVTVTYDPLVLKIRGMPFTASKDDIVTFFEGCQIQQNGIKIVKNSADFPTGTAFVLFETENDVKEALRKNKEYMGCRYIEIFRSRKHECDWAFKTATAEEPEAVVTLTDLNNFFRYHAKHMEILKASLQDISSSMLMGSSHGRTRGSNLFFPYDKRDSTSHEGVLRGKKTNLDVYYIHLSNLPVRAIEPDIIKFFFPIRPVAVRILFDPNNDCPIGEADAMFVSHKDALNAMNKNNHKMNDCYIDLALWWDPQSFTPRYYKQTHEHSSLPGFCSHTNGAATIDSAGTSFHQSHSESARYAISDYASYEGGFGNNYGSNYASSSYGAPPSSWSDNAVGGYSLDYSSPANYPEDPSSLSDVYEQDKHHPDIDNESGGFGQYFGHYNPVFYQDSDSSESDYHVSRKLFMKK